MKADETLAAAYGAIGRGDYAQARERLARLLEGAPAHLAARHALAVCERRLGDFVAARRHFDIVLEAAPNDGEVHNNLANLLDDLGELELAAEHYEQALRLAPRLTAALINQGLVYRKLGQFEAANARLQAGVAANPTSSAGWLGLGLVRRELDDPDGAEAALDEAIRLKPDSMAALRARAQLLADRGGLTAPLWQKVRALAPDDPDLALDEAAARHREGDPDAARLLEPFVGARPRWRAGQAALAQLRWQAGETDFLRGYRAALRGQAGDAEIWLDYLRALMRSGQSDQALTEARRASSCVGPNTALVELEAAAASELGRLDEARALFMKLAGVADQTPRVSHIRFLLRTGAYDAAAAEAEALARHMGTPGHAGWSYLTIAWRLTGDPRWATLEGDERFVTSVDLDELQPNLRDIAVWLRDLHGRRRAPFDQTILRGSQTEGDLFLHRDPQTVVLKAAFAGAVSSYLAALPPAATGHPLLGPPREGFRFAGSWSVRLEAGGRHTNHVHPQGWLSSAFYAALPDGLADDANRSGWLALGAPPAELNLPLDAHTFVEPRAGRLVLFPGYMWHGTLPFPAGERLTVAFDVAPLR